MPSAESLEFDLGEFLHGLTDRCVRLLPGIAAAGLMLADAQGRLQLMAASNEKARRLELFQLQNREGPALECHRGGQPVVSADIASATQRWRRFAPACSEAGFAAVHALPLRRRERILGALDLFQAAPGLLHPAIARIAQAFGDATSIGVLQHRVLREQDERITQLQAALSSRVVIEQAKGMLAERLGLPVEQAFTVLRHHARVSNHRLADLARAVVEGTTDLR